MENNVAAVTKLQELLDSDPNNPSHHFELGCLLWKKGEDEEANEFRRGAAQHFAESAKLDPNNGVVFRYLGHYYSGVSVDTNRAAKCYQRAVTLDPDDVEAGENLCDLLDGEGKESLEVAVCREASEKSPRAYWAFRRLGYLQVYQKKWTEAVQSLQHAIRGYSSCADLWEALGLAYHRIGMFTAALKSYARAVELKNSKVFSLVESGNILLMLGSFTKGIEQLRSALELSPQNVSACFGLASGLLGLSKECMSSGAFSWGATLLEEASSVAKTCTKLVGNVSSTWKLLGDIQMTHARCFPWCKEGSGIEIDKKAFETSIYCWKQKCRSSAVDAKHSYQRALHLSPWEASRYIDVAISLDLVYSLEEGPASNLSLWSLPEKMSLGGLLLDRENNNIWMTLGCLSTKNALKQHAFIRALQLNVSFAVAWSHLGKLYRSIGENKLAKQAFDRARSIDPSLALPWAGMAICIDTSMGKKTMEEAYESCLRATQILPVANFQVGLGALASLSSHLLCPQVYCSIAQAVMRAPFYPESHNLNGLVCEARMDFQSAIAAYRRAKCALYILSAADSRSKVADVTVNLARSLCKAGYLLEAAKECEELLKEGIQHIPPLTALKKQHPLENTTLLEKDRQIYAIALFQLGQYELALKEAKQLASQVSTMDEISRDAALGFICKLLYRVKGLESTVTTILKFPREFFQSSKIKFITYAISGFRTIPLPQSIVPEDDLVLLSHEDISEMRHLISLGKMINSVGVDLNAGTPDLNIGIQNAMNYLKKALHISPNSSSIRTQLSSLLLSSNDWMASHVANRCLVMPRGHSTLKCSKSPYEVLGSAAVACYACNASKNKVSFSACRDQLTTGTHGLNHLQKWLHQEPWNSKARYLLVLNVLQKAREQKFPQNICIALRRMIFTALTDEIYTEPSQSHLYQKFQLLLSLSEIYMQFGDYLDCISQATAASRLLVSKSALFFAHLQMCRAYAALEDLQNLNIEYMNCLQLKTDNEIGCVSLKYLDYKYKLQDKLSHVNSNLEQFIEEKCQKGMWSAIFDLVLCQRYTWDLDFVSAENVLRHANSIGYADRCLLLCHGAICMILARQGYGSQFLSLARSSLIKAQKTPFGPLPIASALLAQAEGSLGSKAKWEKYLRAEWLSWPSERRPAEIYFQMSLLAIQGGTSSDRTTNIELSQDPLRWVLRAIHLNPSCWRYWKVLMKLTELM